MLSPASFNGYPPQARGLAATRLPLLNRLPALFAAILLREIISFDWKFPAERRALEAQLETLGSLAASTLAERMSGFSGIQLPPALEAAGWGVHPAAWMEQLTATLWSTGQTDKFRGAAESYAAWLAQVNPMPRPSQRRLVLVILGRDTPPIPHLFRKLRPHGTLFTRVDPASGLEVLLAEAGKRAKADTGYRHWYVDGGLPAPAPGLTQLSYSALAGPRTQLLGKTEAFIASGTAGPEALRSFLARLQPADLGLATPDPILDRFQLSILTEGSGTQIFATTFVQWAARECLRRAQPETLVLRFAPRQVLQSMNQMLSAKPPVMAGPADPAGTDKSTSTQTAGSPGPRLDRPGSLVDADMAAFYTWINGNRLAGADQMTFLAWHEGHPTVLAIAPTLPANTVSDSALTMAKVLDLAI